MTINTAMKALAAEIEGADERYDDLKRDRNEQYERAESLMAENKRRQRTYDDLLGRLDEVKAENKQMRETLKLLDTNTISHRDEGPAWYAVLGELTLDQILGLKIFFEKQSIMPAAEYTGDEIAELPPMVTKSSGRWAEEILKDAIFTMRDLAYGTSSLEGFRNDLRLQADRLERRAKAELKP